MNERGQRMEQQDIRSFLDMLPEEEVFRVSAEKEDYLLSALVQQLEDPHRFPVVELRGPQSGSRTVANLFADRKRLDRVISNVLCVEEKARAWSGAGFGDCSGDRDTPGLLLDCGHPYRS